MESISEWNLMEMGQFELAYEKITKHIVDDPKRILRYIYNRGLCLLNLEKPEQALLDFQKLIELRQTSDSGYIGAGVALWWMDQKTQAVQIWQNAIDSRYTDAAGGVTVPALLFFAASRLKELNLEKDSIRLLRTRSKTKRASAWPGPVAKFLLGDITEEELLQKVYQFPTLQARMLTKANFWIGVDHYRDGNIESYRYHLNQTRAGHILEPEHYLAKVELQILN